MEVEAHGEEFSLPIPSEGYPMTPEVRALEAAQGVVQAIFNPQSVAPVTLPTTQQVLTLQPTDINALINEIKNRLASITQNIQINKLGDLQQLNVFLNTLQTLNLPTTELENLLYQAITYITNYIDQNLKQIQLNSPITPTITAPTTETPTITVPTIPTPTIGAPNIPNPPPPPFGIPGLVPQYPRRPKPKTETSASSHEREVLEI